MLNVLLKYKDNILSCSACHHYIDVSIDSNISFDACIPRVITSHPSISNLRNLKNDPSSICLRSWRTWCHHPVSPIPENNVFLCPFQSFIKSNLHKIETASCLSFLTQLPTSLIVTSVPPTIVSLQVKQPKLDTKHLLLILQLVSYPKNINVNVLDNTLAARPY